jgi:phosphoribosylglycinamide formyltransferase 1
VFETSFGDSIMRFGFICSAGGSPIFSALDILFSLSIIDKSNVKILSDRSCGAIDTAKKMKLTADIIHWSNSKNFSMAASEYFKDCDFVLLLFSRLVDKTLFKSMPTLNIHPSLLPSFKGFKALEQAIKNQARFFGASLHMVDEGIDNGTLIAQVINPLPIGADISFLSKVSYLQKVYLVLLSIDLTLNGVLNLYPETQSFSWNKETDFSNFANPILINREIQKKYDLLFNDEYPKNYHSKQGK